jgi:hypothetical protein
VITIYNAELEWGMYLICQSGDSNFEMPSQDEIAQVTEQQLYILQKKNMAFIFTESHVEGKTVSVVISDARDVKVSEDKAFSEKIELETSTKRLYFGNIPKTNFVILEFPDTNNPSLQIDGFITDDEISICIYTDDKFRIYEQI